MAGGGITAPESGYAAKEILTRPFAALTLPFHETVLASWPAVAVLSGGNVDPLLLIKLVDHGLSAAGRYLVLRIVLGDRPGALRAGLDVGAVLGPGADELRHPPGQQRCADEPLPRQRPGDDLLARRASSR